jgi:tyrosyl-tRNA synthetase
MTERNVYDVFEERGFIEACTDEEGLSKLFARSRVTAYIGFDPTAQSLHVGSLVPIMSLVHLQRHGHRPIFLLGGGTGLIGDPSGKTEMRQLLTYEQIAANGEGLKLQMSRYLDFSEDRALMLNNADWLVPLSYVDFLRDIGRHFSVNRMLTAESVKQRLETGLSFIEFNYALLQAFDFAWQFFRYDCALQMGGGDQWGNIVAGIDLVRRLRHEWEINPDPATLPPGPTREVLSGAEDNPLTRSGQAYGLVFPLLTTASGGKMGKTEKGTVWLDAELTTPYDYYQFWVNTDDRDVERFLKLFTFVDPAEIDDLCRGTGAELNPAKQRLAFEATAITHGADEADKARVAAEALFVKGSAGAEVGADTVPTTAIEAAKLAEGLAAFTLFVEAGLCKSGGEARRLIKGGGGYLNGERLADPERQVTPADVQEGFLLLRAGKKRYHRLEPR